MSINNDELLRHIKKQLETLIIASRRLATEADCFACGEGERDDLEEAITKVERLTAPGGQDG